MANKFDPSRAAFSRAAHLAARDQVYAPFLKGLDYRIEYIPDNSGANTTLDRYDGIDTLVYLNGNGKLFSLLTVQERFRRQEFMHYQDVTITTGNNRTHQPGEAAKIKAQLFLYGYHDPVADRFLDAYIINMAILTKWMHGDGKSCVIHKLGNDQEQPTVIVKVCHIREINAMEWELTRDAKIADRAWIAIHDHLDRLDQKFIDGLLLKNAPRNRKLNNHNSIQYNGNLFQGADDGQQN